MAAVRRPDLKKYKRVKEDAPEEKKEVVANHLMVSASKPAVLYIRKAIQLINGVEEKKDEKKDEKQDEAAAKEETPAEKFRTITFLGRGKAMKQVVQIVEIVKRRIVGLHQISKIENMQVTDLYTPKQADSGLEDLKIERTIGGLHITLSLDQLDKNDMGYQAPLPEDEVKPEEALKERPRRNNRSKKEDKSGRGAGRGGGRGAAGRGGGRGGASPAPTGRGAAAAATAGRGSGRGAAPAGRGAGGRGGSARGGGRGSK